MSSYRMVTCWRSRTKACRSPCRFALNLHDVPIQMQWIIHNFRVLHKSTSLLSALLRLQLEVSALPGSRRP